MSAEQLVNSHHQGKALCTHALPSAGLSQFANQSAPWDIYIPAPIHPPADRHSTCLLLERLTELLLPLPLHLPAGFSKRNRNLTSVYLICREWCLPYAGEGRKPRWCAKPYRNRSRFLAVPANKDRNLSVGSKRQEHF